MVVLADMYNEGFVCSSTGCTHDDIFRPHLHEQDSLVVEIGGIVTILLLLACGVLTLSSV